MSLFFSLSLVEAVEKKRGEPRNFIIKITWGRSEEALDKKRGEARNFIIKIPCGRREELIDKKRGEPSYFVHQNGMRRNG